MEVYQKFIIETDDTEGDCLILAKCTFHYELVTDQLKVKGGGWWSMDKEKKITLFGSSHDFGDASIEDIQQCIKNKKVFSSKALFNNITDSFNFEYRTVTGDIIKI